MARRRDENSSSDQSGPQILGFATFGSADDSSALESDAEATVKEARKGELRTIYVDPQHLFRGRGQMSVAGGAGEDGGTGLLYSRSVGVCWQRSSDTFLSQSRVHRKPNRTDRGWRCDSGYDTVGQDALNGT